MAPNTHVRTMFLWDMLPKQGMAYTFFEYDTKENQRRILPNGDARAILGALHKKFHPEKPTRPTFDDETAKLIDSGSKFIRSSSEAHKTVPSDTMFWAEAKKGTFLEAVDDEIVFRYVVKLLEARKQAIEDEDTSQFDGKTAQAVDRFTSTVDVATALSSDVVFGLDIVMSGDLGDYVWDGEDFDDEVHDEKDKEHGDDGKMDVDTEASTATPTSTAQSHATVGVEAEPAQLASAISDAVNMLSMSGNWWEAPSCEDAMEEDEME